MVFFGGRRSSPPRHRSWAKSGTVGSWGVGAADPRCRDGGATGVRLSRRRRKRSSGSRDLVRPREMRRGRQPRRGGGGERPGPRRAGFADVRRRDGGATGTRPSCRRWKRSSGSRDLARPREMRGSRQPRHRGGGMGWSVGGGSRADERAKTSSSRSSGSGPTCSWGE